MLCRSCREGAHHQHCCCCLQGCTQLTELHVHDCLNVSPAEIRELAATRPQLSVVVGSADEGGHLSGQNLSEPAADSPCVVLGVSAAVPQAMPTPSLWPAKGAALNAGPGTQAAGAAGPRGQLADTTNMQGQARRLVPAHALPSPVYKPAQNPGQQAAQQGGQQQAAPKWGALLSFLADQTWAMKLE
jgi:hypothetical protein